MIKTLALAVILLLGASSAEAAVRCALLVESSLTLLQYGSFDRADCPPDPTGKGWIWVPAPLAEKPAFNPDTQVLEGPTVTVTADQVTQSYSVREMTPAEIEAVKQEKVDGISEAVLRALCSHENRIRTLNSQPNLTLAQCRAALKGLL